MNTYKFILYLFISLFLLYNVNAQDSNRLQIAFNDNWEFSKCTSTDVDSLIQNWKNITIPHTWNAKDMQEGKDFYEGYALYKNTFTAPKEWNGKRVFIRFEGVGQVAEVYVNDRYLGKHEGSYAAFVFDLSYDLEYGKKNKIVIKVNNVASKRIIPTRHSLFGIYGGIYRPASLIITNKTNISTTDYASSGIYITQKNVSKEKADIKIATKLESIEKGLSNIILESVIYDHKGQKVDKIQTKILMSPQGRKVFYQEFNLNNPHLWHGKKDPYLYKVVVSLKDENSIIIDQVTQPLGIRKFEVKGGDGFYLNNEKYSLHGVSRHQDWFDHGNALSNWQHDKDLELINEIGATTIRLAHYQQSKYFYHKCDSLGFIVSAEIPFVQRITNEEHSNAKLQMEELVKQNFNHPSIYTWGLHNEVKSKKPSDFGMTLTRDLNEIAKSIDPDRLTISVNGHGHMDHADNKNADIQGMNRYYGWYYGQVGDIKNWVETLKKNYPDHAVILSEYGAGANIDHQVEEAPEKVGYRDQFFPESYATRFHEIQWGDIANQDYLIGSYVWNMFDFGLPLWSRGGVPARNHKGLVTYDRKNKKDSFYWYKANWNDEPMVYISDRRATQRTKVSTDIHVYCNTSNLKLKIDGKRHPSFEKGKTNVHYIFKDVQLKKGENKIEATAGRKKNISDHVIWKLITK